MESLTFETLHPTVVLGIAAHPDDLDFGASGTIATFAQQGASVYYLILTDGGKGSEDRNMTSEKLTALRHREQRAAGRILGLTDVYFCDYPDGTLQNTIEVKREVVRFIRKTKPNVVITMDPSVLYSASRGFINHPDHRAAGQAALDAVFPLARDHMTFPELLAEGYEPHKTGTILMINLEQNNYAVDITAVLKKKFQAIAAHKSQIPDTDIMQARMTEWSKVAGQRYGMQYAETFMRVDIS